MEIWSLWEHYVYVVSRNYLYIQGESNMDTQPLDTKALRIVQEDKLRELQAQQENIKHLQAEMAVINEKLKKKEKLSEEDTKFISEMGWLSALAVTISALATSL